MSNKGRSLQQIDPLTAATSWEAAIFIILLTWVYVVLATVSSLVHVSHVALMAIAVTFMTLSFGLHLWFAAPRHAPYGKRSYALVVFFAISAACFQVGSMDNHVTGYFFEWGPIALALLFASASGYRPLSDQYFAGLAAVLSVGGLLALTSLRLDIPFGPAYFAVSGITLIAIVVLGQASYTQKATSVLRAWNATVSELTQQPSQPRNSVTAEVTKPFLDEVKHFYVELLETGRVNAVDVEKARQLSGEIRSELLTLSTRTWVERIGCELHDPENLLGRFDLASQSSISALITGLRDNGVRSISVSLRSDPVTGRLSCVVLGKDDGGRSDSSYRLRTKLAPYLRVMYVVFQDVRMIEQDGEVKVLFYYAS
ncbi:hypothetical protein AINA4_12910 [Aurantimicrobium sp. INA4]|uniref:hypothetical protein n=1 Tax=Aurantimicrobium sp. INA4 TaxID=2986279 RepID=UPI002492F265|nr:hypothetical protein [Aurantimicrobium sp. INA4]BDU11370.1 hypothetical protein AINA4_12910 [Aurantimicrobium sp. INA4]